MKQSRYNLLALLVISLLVSAMLAACGDITATTAATTSAAAANTTATGATTAAGATTTAATTTKAPAPTITPVPPVAQPPGSLKLTFWYGLTGVNGNAVQQVVNRYNSSQTRYYVEAIQQPDYDSTINKLNTALAGGGLPNILQIYDIGTQRMVDTKRIIPVQDFIDKEQSNILQDLEPAVANYFTIGGKLYSLPFNASTPVLYFNKAAFREVGLDTEKKIWTFDELYDAARKLVKKDSSGKIIRSGFDFNINGWFLEEEEAIAGTLYATPDNGRTQRATRLTFNNETGINWVNFLKKLQDDGVGRSLGKTGGTNGTTRDTNFVNGDAAMIIESIAGLRNYLNGAAQSGGKVEVGVAYFPRPAGATGGVTPGGASLWITNQGTAEQQAGAWDFVKFAASPEIQAFFSANTGYYPVRKSAYNIQEMKDTLAKYPQFKVAVDQLHDTKPSAATAGAVLGTFVGTRQNAETAMEMFLTGKASSAKAALDDAVNKSNDALDEYNSTQK